MPTWRLTVGPRRLTRPDLPRAGYKSSLGLLLLLPFESLWSCCPIPLARSIEVHRLLQVVAAAPNEFSFRSAPQPPTPTPRCGHVCHRRASWGWTVLTNVFRTLGTCPARAFIRVGNLETSGTRTGERTKRNQQLQSRGVGLGCGGEGLSSHPKEK